MIVFIFYKNRSIDYLKVPIVDFIFVKKDQIDYVSIFIFYKKDQIKT